MESILQELGIVPLFKTLRENLLACPKAAAINDPEFLRAVQQFLSDARVKESVQILGNINRELCEWLDILPAIAGMASPIVTDMLQNERCREYLANVMLSGSRLLKEFLYIVIAKK
jgi:hypothetical protein